MKLITTLLTTLLFVSIGAIANTTKLTEEDKLLIQRTEAIKIIGCAEAQYNKLLDRPEMILDLQNVFYSMRDNIKLLVESTGMGIHEHDGTMAFTIDDAAIMLVSSCIAPARN